MTEKGTLRHVKILDTSKAWEVYERLEETYYRTPKDDIYSALEERAKCKLKTRLNDY